MIIAGLLLLATAAALLCACKGLWRAAAVLGSILVSEAVRNLFKALRHGDPTPYTGLSYWLWLPGPATFLALPAVLLGAVAWPHWQGPALLWGAEFLFVAIRYPEVRGDELLHLYAATYMFAGVVAASILIWRGLRRERLLRDELALLTLAVGYVANVVIVFRYGRINWWSSWIIDAAAYAGVAAIAMLRRGDPTDPSPVGRAAPEDGRADRGSSPA